MKNFHTVPNANSSSLINSLREIALIVGIKIFRETNVMSVDTYLMLLSL